MNPARPYHSQDANAVLEQWGVNRELGLSHDAVQERRERYGRNELRQAKTRTLWLILWDQFKSIVIVIMVAAAVLAFATARWPEGFALVGVTVVNTLIGFFSEWKALRSMEALRRLGEHRTRVRRDAEVQSLPAVELVPGDVALMGPEDLVPADMRLVRAEQLRVNEAALTGESVPVIKRLEPVKEKTPLADRTNMLYKGTSLTEGTAEAVVVATGMETELGRISALAEQAEEQATPLQQRLDALGRRLAWITLCIAVLVALAGLAAGQETRLMIETAIALGVAAIPEGLPIVATIALARGMYLMARRNALVNRLTAVETLGATHVIFTDKTGTLTQNKMTVRRLVTSEGERELNGRHTEHGGRSVDGGGENDAAATSNQSTVPSTETPGTATETPTTSTETSATSTDAPATPTQTSRSSTEASARHERSSLVHRILQTGVLCNNASLGDGESQRATGDPTEQALLEAGLSVGIERDELLQRMPEEREESFDPDVMMMATFHRSEDGFRVAVKGAPQTVIESCTKLARSDGDADLSDEERERWQQQGRQLARQGLRVLGIADKRVGDSGADPYSDLCLIGLVGMVDPPRDDVRDAIVECQNAGMRAVMITGDQPDTATAIAESVGLTHDGTAIVGSQLEDLDSLSADDRQQILKTSVFARVTPEQKLNLVELYQEEGEVVAMTGDGVNDAPALKQADIGVAMGQRGTDAAKQVADMVLRDDKFGTIVAAVRQGRIIFANIRKSVMFMLCTNIAEILIVTLASVARAPIPLRPLQILYLNVLTDVFPALALGVGAGSAYVMQRPPRDRSESVLTRHHWIAIGGWSTVVGACVLGSLTLALQWLGYQEEQAVTVSFLTLAFAKLWFVLNLRDRGSQLWDNDIVKNPWIWGALALCAVLLLVAVYWPPLAEVLPTQPPTAAGWALILGMSLIPALLGTVAPGIRFHTSKE